MTPITRVKIVGSTVDIAGVAVLWYFGSGWIALGAVLLLWGNNMHVLASVGEVMADG